MEFISEFEYLIGFQWIFSTYIQYGIQYAHIVGLCGIEVHEVVKSHRFLGWCGITRFRLGMQQLFRLQFIRTGGTVERQVTGI